ncbi:MAG: hypothetical protein OXN83_02790 [Oligoflexia bacterium]|nr:hypothetical protein [Oligoflexia bacterium]
MTHFKRKTFFENRYSLNKLIEFRNLVVDYSKNLSYNPYFPPTRRDLVENQKAINIRTEINKVIDSVRKILLEANIPVGIIYSFPPAAGGRITNLDLLLNIFNLKDYDVPLQQLIDIIDRGIGVYSDDKIWSIIRTFNPINYFMRLLEFIFNIPFNLLKNIGFDTQKIETNFIVKTIKFIYLCICSLVSFLTLLNLLGYLEKFKASFKYLMNYISQ